LTRTLVSAPFRETVRLAGQKMDGAMVSATITEKEHVLCRNPLSVAVQTTVEVVAARNEL
jgi:hypothetical protein